MHLSSYFNSVSIQLLIPGHEYPKNIFKHQDALYYASKDIVFIATKPISFHDDDEVYTEVAIWEPAEIRLISTLTLSVPENGGWVGYFPWDFAFSSIPTIPEIPITVDLSSDNVISSCINYARCLLQNNNEKFRKSYILRVDRQR